MPVEIPSAAGESVDIAGSGAEAAKSVGESGLDGTTKIILIIVIVILVLVGIAATVAEHEKKKLRKSRDLESGSSDVESLLRVREKPYEPRRNKLVNPTSSDGQFSIAQLQLSTGGVVIAEPPSPYLRDERLGEPSTASTHKGPIVRSKSV